MNTISTNYSTRTCFLSFSAGAAIIPGANGELTIQTSRGCTTLKRLTPGVRDALQRLCNGGANEDELERFVSQQDGLAALTTFQYRLNQLARRGILYRTVRDQQGLLATLIPISPYFTFLGRRVDHAQSYALSRFAFTHVEEGRTLLESPLAHARLVLHDWRAAALVQMLALPGRVAEAAESIPGLSVETAAAVMELLLNAVMLGEADEWGTPMTDRSPALQSWEFHDLLFHSRTREGRHDLPIGGTCRLAGKLDPPPAIKPVPPREWIDLGKPDISRSEREDPPFTQVLERRRSLRQYGQAPITCSQLGQFLYRVVRVKEFREVDIQTGEGPVRLETASRPYPAGGALYELECYLAVNACGGLQPGFYFYDAVQHRLGRLAGPTAEVHQLLMGAGDATGIPVQNLQILLILTARFQRVAWKYAAIAYSLILKHVGVLYQTMYLTATAMGLAPCAVGCGNADLFARAAGSDYYHETSVGEFLLGSLPQGATENQSKWKQGNL